MDITSKDRRALMILGAVAVAALVLFVFVVHKGKSSSPTSPAAVSGSQQSPSPQPSPSSHGTKTSSHKSHHSHPVVLQARDPFKPLVTDSPAPAASAPAPSPSPSPPPPPNPAPSPPPSNGNFPASIQLSGHTLTLDGFQQPQGGSKQAVVTIDGTKFFATPAQAIEYQFKLDSINAPCASFSHGSQPFTLCVSSPSH